MATTRVNFFCTRWSIALQNENLVKASQFVTVVSRLRAENRFGLIKDNTVITEQEKAQK